MSDGSETKFIHLQFEKFLQVLLFLVGIFVRIYDISLLSYFHFHFVYGVCNVKNIEYFCQFTKVCHENTPFIQKHK